MGRVEFGGFSIPHVGKRIDAVGNEGDEDDEVKPPSMVSSADTEPKMMQEVEEESDDEDEAEPPVPWWLAMLKQYDGEDQDSRRAIAKLNQERSNRAMKRVRQQENRKNKGMKLCSMGCGCSGVECGIEVPPCISAK